MCGIAGIKVGKDWRPEGAIQSVIDAMAGALAHRGPDDQGTWIDVERGIGLGHRRLAIVDLSPGGHQPMSSHDGQLVIAFNGEIYNHLELREELGGPDRFRSHSDTEVLVEAVRKWGILHACRRLTGMFAFAVWDKRDGVLSLARDRMGKKPLYCWHQSGVFAFASELKAFWQIAGFRPTLSKDAIASFLRYGYVPEHQCVFEGAFKVQPGEVVSVGSRQGLRRETYWHLSDVVANAKRQPVSDIGQARAELKEVLQKATRRRMLADVPLGAFLSGGIDSGLVVSLMQEAASEPVRTFSIGFEDKRFDEAPVAKAVAAHLGTSHTELYVNDDTALALVPEMPHQFDEPFADASQLPTSLLAALTRKHVTVALTGDGGDELFGGYARYRHHHGLLGRIYRWPAGIRYPLANAIAAVPTGLWESAFSLLPARRRPRFIGSKMRKLARTLATRDAAQRTREFLSHWNPSEVMRESSAQEPDPCLPSPGLLSDASEQMQFWETLHYLPGDLLAKVDRATMASSLEARCPLLDHAVVELAWRLPTSLKAAPGTSGKLILRELLFEYVPRSLVDLPKQGFSVPIGEWLRSRLREWADEAMQYGRKELDGLLRWDVINDRWSRHLTGEEGHADAVWLIVMLCAWHRHWFTEQSTKTVPARRPA